MKCTTCGHDNPDKTTFCIMCGAKLEAGVASAAANQISPPQPIPQSNTPQSPACPQCGKPITQGGKFCTGCGFVLSAAPAQAQPAPVQQAPVQPAPAPNAQYIPAQPVQGAPAYTDAVSRKKSMVWIPICVAAILVLGAIGFLFMRFKDNISGIAFIGEPPVLTDSISAPPSIDEYEYSQEAALEAGREESLNEESDNQAGDKELSDDEIIEEVSQTLLYYYLNYLDAINEQDESYLIYATPEQKRRLEERIFGVNSNDLFTFMQISIDMDTLDINRNANPQNVTFYAAFQYSYKSRRGNSSLEHGANIQYVSMIYDEDNREWLVDSSEITKDVDEIGPHRMILK